MVKQKMNQCKDAQLKKELGTTYRTLDKEVKSARRDERHFYDTLVSEAEQAAGKRDLTTLYQMTRLLCGREEINTDETNDSDGNLVSKEEKQRKRWADYFKKLLNRPPSPPATRPKIPPAAQPQNYK
ncbi:unnamed protein product [Heterobilharzia americana]|nr:unnamed protein product [Heterobilharzia americana]